MIFLASDFAAEIVCRFNGLSTRNANGAGKKRTFSAVIIYAFGVILMEQIQ